MCGWRGLDCSTPGRAGRPPKPTGRDPGPRIPSSSAESPVPRGNHERRGDLQGSETHRQRRGKGPPQEARYAGAWHQAATSAPVASPHASPCRCTGKLRSVTREAREVRSAEPRTQGRPGPRLSSALRRAGRRLPCTKVTVSPERPRGPRAAADWGSGAGWSADPTRCTTCQSPPRRGPSLLQQGPRAALPRSVARALVGRTALWKFPDPWQVRELPLSNNTWGEASA